MAAQDRVLNVGAVEESSSACGPGARFVVWVQGCERACPGCLNPEFQPVIEREMITTEALAHRIICAPGIEGVTYTGGEPMLQAGALAELSRRVREAGLSVVCYTGYTLDELRDSEDPDVVQLLASLDVLIDGPYMPDQAGYALWRGSRNQRVHFLTDRYRDWRGRVDAECADAEFSVDAVGLTATGIWPDELLERLREHMGK